MKGFEGMRDMKINHRRTRTGLANARPILNAGERKRGVPLSVCGSEFTMPARCNLSMPPCMFYPDSV